MLTDHVKESHWEQGNIRTCTKMLHTQTASEEFQQSPVKGRCKEINCTVNLVLCDSCFHRPVFDSSRSDGPNALQYVHTTEDDQRQPQPQTTVHGETLMT